MRIIKALFLALLASPLTLAATGSAAMAGNTALGLGVGTLGAEVHAVTNLSRYFDLALSYSTYEYDDTVQDDDRNTFEVTADIEVPRLGLQFFPFGGGLLLEAGLAFGAPDIAVKARADENARFKIGNITYDADDIGTLTGTVDFENDQAPYFLIGLGRHVGGGWAWNMSLGAVQYGKPSAKLRTDCTFDLLGNPLGAAACATVKGSLLLEEAKVNDDLEDFELWPVVRLGLSYSF